MHVLVIPGSFPNSYNTYMGIFFKHQVLALAKQNVQVGVIAPDIRFIKDAFNRNQLKQWGVNYTEFIADGKVPVMRKTAFNVMPYFSFWNQYIFKRYTRKLFKKYVLEYGYPDIIHAHTALWAGWSALSLAKKHQIPFVLTEHSSAILKNNLSKREHKITAKVFESAHHLISVSSALKNKIVNDFHVEVEIIPNVIDLSRFSISHKHNKNVLFALGTLYPAKGFDVLIQAFVNCLNHNPNFHLFIGGDGPELSKLISKTRALKIEKNISFLGRLSPNEVADFMQSAGIFVSASYFETFGVVLAEAAATGMPLVSLNSGGPADIVNDINGLLYPVNQPEELSKAILNIYHHYDQYDCKKISEDIHSRFGANKITAQILKVYDKILA